MCHHALQDKVFKGNIDFYVEVINKCRLLFLIVHDAPTALLDAGLYFRERIKMIKVLISSNKNHFVFQLHLLVTAVYGVSGICQLFLMLLLSSHCLKSTFGELQARFAGSSSPS